MNAALARAESRTVGKNPGKIQGLPMNDVIRESVAFLDRYLGPVTSGPQVSPVIA
jgi:hypothetical protein